MKNRILLSLYLSFILHSCVNEGAISLSVTEPLFRVKQELSFQPIHSDYLMSYPVAIYLTDSSIILQDSRGKDYFFHAINRKTGRLESEFGAVGRAPGELLSAAYSNTISTNKDTLSLFDDESKKIVHYVNSNGTFKFYSEYKIPETINSKGNIKICLNHKGAYLAAGYNGLFIKNRFAIFNDRSQIIRTIGEYPNMSSYNIDSTNYQQLFYGPSFFRLNPSKTKAAFGTYKGALMEIFDLSKFPDEIKKDTSILFCAPFNKNETLDKNSGIRFGFEDLVITRNRIYTLFNGKTGAENPYFTKDIKVFNLKGEPVIEYNIGIDLRCLAVDEDTNEIYAIVYEPTEKGFFLIKMQIPNQS